MWVGATSESKKGGRGRERSEGTGSRDGMAMAKREGSEEEEEGWEGGELQAGRSAGEVLQKLKC